MSTDWQSISVVTDGVERTPCDCCGHTTIEYRGDLYRASDWIAFYWVRLAEGHPEACPTINIGTGDWSEGTGIDSRWVFAAEYSKEAEGFRLLDMARESDSATFLDRKDILETNFQSEAFSMLDAIFMKDDRVNGALT